MTLKEALAEARVEVPERVLQEWAEDMGFFRRKVHTRLLEKGTTFINLRAALLGDRDGEQIAVTERDKYHTTTVKIDFSKMLPLAIAKAGAKHVDVEVWRDGEIRFSGQGWKRSVKEAHKGWGSGEQRVTNKADVPVIPTTYRPKDIVLFEAKWERAEVEVRREVIDPALLRPVKGLIYQVVDVWDLTEAEAMALDRSII